eukprot:TRINITY_DN7233_c0_g1_i6.p1 TRINITY_DN7233_c0_g1~~TRINITY_DN7233_c0_g1_i6.p1  ORF type:complete len:424 (-),score=55.01 TRINITY_DN7233_c0_g1_i6:415-1686(-)
MENSTSPLMDNPIEFSPGECENSDGMTSFSPNPYMLQFLGIKRKRTRDDDDIGSQCCGESVIGEDALSDYSLFDDEPETVAEFWKVTKKQFVEVNQDVDEEKDDEPDIEVLSTKGRKVSFADNDAKMNKRKESKRKRNRENARKSRFKLQSTQNELQQEIESLFKQLMISLGILDHAQTGLRKMHDVVRLVGGFAEEKRRLYRNLMRAIQNNENEWKITEALWAYMRHAGPTGDARGEVARVLLRELIGELVPEDSVFLLESECSSRADSSQSSLWKQCMQHVKQSSMKSSAEVNNFEEESANIQEDLDSETSRLLNLFAELLALHAKHKNNWQGVLEIFGPRKMATVFVNSQKNKEHKEKMKSIAAADSIYIDHRQVINPRRSASSKISCYFFSVRRTLRRTSCASACLLRRTLCLMTAFSK